MPMQGEHFVHNIISTYVSSCCKLRTNPSKRRSVLHLYLTPFSEFGLIETAFMDRESDIDDAPSPKRAKTFATTDSRTIEEKAKKRLHKSKYQVCWRTKRPCVAPAKGNPHAFHCNVCRKDVSCGHQGEKDVTRHMETSTNCSVLYYQVRIIIQQSNHGN